MMTKSITSGQRKQLVRFAENAIEEVLYAVRLAGVVSMKLGFFLVLVGITAVAASCSGNEPVPNSATGAGGAGTGGSPGIACDAGAPLKLVDAESPLIIGQDEENVYWTSQLSYSIFKAAKSGAGAPIQVVGPRPQAEGFAAVADESGVYYLENTDLKVAHSDGTVGVLLSGVPAPSYPIIADAENLFYFDTAAQDVFRVDKSTGTLDVLAAEIGNYLVLLGESGSRLLAFRTMDNAVSELLLIDKSSGAYEIVVPTTASVGFISAATVDSTDTAFWTEYTADANGRVGSVSLPAGIPTTLFGDQRPGKCGIIADEQSLHWMSQDSGAATLKRAPKQGGTLEERAILPGGWACVRLISDASYLYYGVTVADGSMDHAGAIWRMCK